MVNCRLLKIKLTNFGAFENFTVDLSKDITNIIGENASGKSTIINALKLSLQLNDKKIPVHKFVRKTPDDSVHKAIVDLDMEINGELVKEHSEFSKGTINGNGRKITRKITLANGEVYENARANTYLTDTLGKTNLEIMFAIKPRDNFIKAQESDNLKNLMEILSLDFSKELEVAKLNLKNHDSELQKAKENLSNHLAKITATSSLQDSYRADLQSKKDQLEKLNVNSNIEKDIQDLTEKLKDAYYKLQVASDACGKADETNKKNANLESSIHSAEKEVEKFKAELSLLETKNKVRVGVDEMRSLLKEIEEVRKNKEKDVSSGKESLVGVNYHIKGLQQKLDAVKGGLCPTCNQPTKDVTLQVENEMNKLLQSQKEIQDSLNALLDSQNEINRKYEETIDNIKKGEKANDEIQKDENRKLYLENMISTNEKQIEFWRHQITEFITKEGLTEDLKNAESEYHKCNSDLKSLRETMDEISKLRTLISSQESNISIAEQQIQFLKEETPKLTNEIEIKESILKDDQRLVHLCEMIPIVYIEKCKKDIMTISSQFVRPFGYESVYLDLDVDAKRLSYELVKDGLHMTYDLMSGFETDLVNLAIVGTIAHILKVPSLCIDELDSHADENKSERIADLIMSISKGTQIIAITHKSDIVSQWSQKSNSLSIIKLSGGNVENNRE